jgi:sugar phosphate isomerase/epimerase
MRLGNSSRDIVRDMQRSLTKFTRRSFLASTVPALAALKLSAANKRIPVGLELYSVRNELSKDLTGTLDAVAKMGYECVEFFGPYFEWTADYAKQVRKQLDDLKISCYSTHNGVQSFGDGLSHAIDLNKILGTKYIVMASAGKAASIDDWKRVAQMLNKANDAMSAYGLHAGYHNHAVEWKPIGGQMPMQVLADNTDKSIMLQLDVGTCVEMGKDPVAWIDNHPGRIKSLHLKDWSPDKGYQVLFGQGIVPWKKVFEAAESKGGVEYYLIEQEGSEFPETETADRCLIAFRDIHG